MPTTFLCGKELPSATPVMMRATMPTDSIPHAKSWHLRHMPAAAFVSPTPLHFHRPFSSTQVAQTRLKGIFSSRRRRAICALNMNTGQVQDSGSKPSAAELPNVPTPPPEPSDSIPTSSRMFSNIEPAADGSLKRVPSSELACTALVGGTMIGCGILALPSVATPSGFIPSSSSLLAVWAYMATTGLLISGTVLQIEVTISTACALGRASGVSMLSLGTVTLGRFGTFITTASYLLLHYAILTAYIAQGGSLFAELLASLPLPLPHPAPEAFGLNGLLFATGLGGTMYVASREAIEKLNTTLVFGVLLSFVAILVNGGTHIDIASLLPMHWDVVTKGELIPVLFVSCVYQNVIATISMRLEGDRSKIRRAVLIGSGIPVAMFVAYDAVIIGSGNGMLSDNAHVAVQVFSLLAVATSFIGFVEALIELCADARQTVGIELRDRWPDFAATLIPPVIFAASTPDIFLKALDIAGTYGIAVLFGVLPAAMTWRNRDAELTQGFSRMVGGGKGLLAIVATLPLTLIGSRLWNVVNTALHASALP